MKHPSGNKYQVIGTMSGTSLDGMDLAAVEFTHAADKWSFDLIAAQTIPYPTDWQNRLRHAPELPGRELLLLHNAYGRFTGQKIKDFTRTTGVIPDIIASHGHTIFHQPENHFTFQLGNGAAIAAETGITTIADFRTTDVALGGQGAPLVPVGDRFLFGEFEACLNLGGFANISFEKNGQRIAFDVCPANFILNLLSEKEGSSYDENGRLGREGILNNSLLHKLNQLPFYQEKPPKSLGREWMEAHLLPVMNAAFISNRDKLRTAYEHIALQIARALPEKEKTLVTGGGALNTFLMERIKSLSKAEIVVPDTKIIEFKEALIFAFLGLLRFLETINCYSSVTGARKDSLSGLVFRG